MVRERYERPRRFTSMENGHKSDCPFTDNFGRWSCDCDGSIADTPAAELVRQQIVAAMVLNGWTTSDEPGARQWLFFQKTFGPHRITICRVSSGWQVVWIRGVGWTILEERSFGNITVAMNVLMECMVANHDTAQDLYAENIQLRLEATPKTTVRLTSVPKGEEG